MPTEDCREGYQDDKDCFNEEPAVGCAKLEHQFLTTSSQDQGQDCGREAE